MPVITTRLLVSAFIRWHRKCSRLAGGIRYYVIGL
jgi:hypothetical protein